MVQPVRKPSSPRRANQIISNQRSFAVLILAGLTVSVMYANFASKSPTSDLLRTGNDHKLRLETEEFPKMSYNDPAFEMNSIRAPDYHLVVSTGCSTFQDWQAYVLFFHAMKSGQVSTSSQDDGSLSYVTRVVSGCNSEQAAKMNEIHERTIAPIAPGRFFIHHTPDYQL